MFVSINHLSVTEGRETDFEELWRPRDRSVEKLPGFVSLDILQPGRTLTMKPGEPPVKTDNVYMVLTRWETQDAFNAWVGSDAFKKAHSRVSDKTIFAGPARVTLHGTIEGAGA